MTEQIEQSSARADARARMNRRAGSAPGVAGAAQEGALSENPNRICEEARREQRTTLHNWRKLPGFQEAVNAMARIELAKQVPDVYDAIAREAIAGSYQHAKLMLELLEEYEETLNLNVDDKREKVNARLDELAERRRARMAG